MSKPKDRGGCRAISCGLPLPKRRRRYCSDKCRRNEAEDRARELREAERAARLAVHTAKREQFVKDAIGRADWRSAARAHELPIPLAERWFAEACRPI